MSYEPTLIISKDQLQAKSDSIEQYCWQKRPKQMAEKERLRLAAYNELYNYLSYEGVKFCGVNIILAYPELTHHNREVRSLLKELNIEYAVYD